MANAVRGIIFDVDGTLVDSNDAHARAWADALAEHGHTVEFQKIRDLIGKGGDKLLPEVSGVDVESDEGKKIAERRGEIFLEKYLPELAPTPGARDLLETARARGLKMVVASSAERKELSKILAVAGAEEFMEDTTSSDDADNSKPDPDIVVAALDSIGLDAGEVVMVGDTPYDVEAARKAGVRTIALRSGGWDDARLAGAIAVFADPAELARRIDETPLGEAKAASAEADAGGGDDAP